MARILGVVSSALLLSLLLAKSSSGQQAPNQPPNSIGQRNLQSTTVPAVLDRQAGTDDSSRTIGPQQTDDRALEISRQPPGNEPAGHNETEATHAFEPSEEVASIDRNLDTEQEQHWRTPYLGITIAENSECLLGHEEHTLEVLSVSPGSPADQAGLNTTGAFSAPKSIAEAIFMPIGLAAHALLHRAGMPGHRGDLIIGVNDCRVHDKAELDRELKKLKPGDSAYLNLLRLLPGGSHQTMRLFIKVGEWRTDAPVESASRSIGAASFDSSGNVSYAY